jgi:hypothetical protein
MILNNVFVTVTHDTARVAVHHHGIHGPIEQFADWSSAISSIILKIPEDDQC